MPVTARHYFFKYSARYSIPLFVQFYGHNGSGQGLLGSYEGSLPEGLENHSVPGIESEQTTNKPNFIPTCCTFTPAHMAPLVMKNDKKGSGRGYGSSAHGSYFHQRISYLLCILGPLKVPLSLSLKVCKTIVLKAICFTPLLSNMTTLVAWPMLFILTSVSPSSTFKEEALSSLIFYL